MLESKEVPVHLVHQVNGVCFDSKGFFIINEKVQVLCLTNVGARQKCIVTSGNCYLPEVRV